MITHVTHDNTHDAHDNTHDAHDNTRDMHGNTCDMHDKDVFKPVHQKWLILPFFTLGIITFYFYTSGITFIVKHKIERITYPAYFSLSP